MAITRSSSSTKEKVRPLDLPQFLGFNTALLPIPSNVDINRYAFEIFFENSLRPEIGKFALNSDHLEHGFQMYAEKSQEYPKLKLLINHLFLFAFTEILFADGSSRANIFLERQKDNCSLSPEEIRQLVDLNPELTDSITTIFDHLVAPIDINLDADFFKSVNQIFDSAPAVSFLLRHFLHDENSNVVKAVESKSTPLNQLNLMVHDDKLPQYFTETSSPNIQQRTTPFAEFRMVRHYPVIYINQPKYIAPPLPSLSCIHIPKYADFAVVSKVSPAAVFSSNSQLFYVNELTGVVELHHHPETITALCFSTDGKWILSGDSSGGILLQSVDKKRFTWYEPARSLVTSIAVAPSFLHQFVVGLLDGTALIYDVSQKSPVRMLVGHSMSVSCVDMHPNSEFVATAGSDGYIRVWSVTKGECVRLLKGAGQSMTTVKFSHDGHSLFCSAASGEILIYDVGAAKARKYRKLAAGLVCADFSPDDEVVAGFDGYGNFLMWETKEMQNESPETVRIDRTRVIGMEFTNSAEIRIVGCQK